MRHRARHSRGERPLPLVDYAAPATMKNEKQDKMARETGRNEHCHCPGCSVVTKPQVRI